MELTVILTAIIGVTVMLVFYITKVFQSSPSPKVDTEEEESPQENHKEEKNSTQKTKKKGADKKVKEVKTTFTHKWLLTSLKGHSGRVLDLDFSANGKFLASCGEDRTVLVWMTKDFNQKDHKCLRGNVEYDHGLFVKWSPDSKAYVVQKAVQNCVEVYKINKKPDGGLGNINVAVTFPSLHETDIVGLGIASTGRFIITCSDKTDLIVWDLKGEVLARLDTYHNLTYCAKVSPCGRFVATSGFTPDVKVWAVKFNRSGEFEKVSRAFDLTGHSSGVYGFAFNSDSSRMATVSKDGTWKVYDTNIEYEKGQDPSIIISGKYMGDPNHRSIVALSPDGRVVAIAHDKSVRFYSVLTGESEGELLDVHTDPVTSISFDNESKYVLTAGDKHVRVFHNVPGHRIAVQDLQATLKKQSSNSAARDRIEAQIQQAEEALSRILG